MNYLIDKINKIYDLKIDYLYEKVKGGYLTDNFSLSDGQHKYFLKQYRSDDVEIIQNIHKVKQFFADYNIPIILPIKDTNNETYFTHENKIYTLFPFVNGKTIPRLEQTSETLRSLTQMLAKIHLISRDGCPPIVKKEKSGWDLEKFHQQAKEYLLIINNKPNDKFDLAARKHIEIQLKLSENIKGNFEDLCLKNDHLLHGDFHEHNVFYDENKNISHVFDLEKAVVGPRVSELIRMIDFVAFDNQYNDKTYNNAKMIFDIYNEIYPLSFVEWHDGLLNYFYKDFSNLWILKKHYIEGNYRPDFYLYNSLQGDEYLCDHFKDHLNKLLSFHN